MSIFTFLLTMPPPAVPRSLRCGHCRTFVRRLHSMGNQLHVCARPLSLYSRDILLMYTAAEANITVTVFDSSDFTLFTSSGQAFLPPDSSAPVPGCYIPDLSSLKTNFSFVFATIATSLMPNLPRSFPKTYWLSLKSDVLDWCIPPYPCTHCRCRHCIHELP